MGDMVLAKEMISAAKEAGAYYAKFQTWSVSRLKAGPWDHDGRLEIYIKAELTEDQHYELKEYCDLTGIKFMSSVFSVADAKLVHGVIDDYIKIPSMESRNIDLLKYVNENFNKVYLSTGTSTFDEIKKSVGLLNKPKIVLMHCVSSYPCQIEDANLSRIKYLRSLCPKVGYSDHVQGIEAARIALEYGIEVIEKHFTIDNNLPGRDNKFAILPRDLSILTDYIKSRNSALKDQGKDYLQSEQEVSDLYSGRFSDK